MEDKDVVKLLVPLRMVPDGATVTKRTGEKEYVVSRAVRIYGDGPVKQAITPDAGTVFLVGPEGNLNAIGEGVEVIWKVAVWELRDFVNGEGEYSR